jgi:hypothetical protein
MSVRALASLAEALRLSRAERAYLFALAGKPEPRQDAEPAVPAACLRACRRSRASLSAGSPMDRAGME